LTLKLYDLNKIKKPKIHSTLDFIHSEF